MKSSFDDLPDSAIAPFPTVKAVTGKSRPTIWRWGQAGLFPLPVKIGPNSVGWNVGELRAWLRERSQQRTA